MNKQLFILSDVLVRRKYVVPLCSAMFHAEGTPQVIDFKGENAVLPLFVPLFLNNNKATEIFFHFTMLTGRLRRSEVLFGKRLIIREQRNRVTSKRLTC